ncbi:MAG: membrane protein insertase YidC [Magnetococcales bacterium]|nr:membrane protein insertase YidC [Magnetococcales bacterium]
MDQRTLLAISLSFMLLMAYQIFMETYYPPEPIPQQIVEQQPAVADTQKADTGPAPSTIGGVRVGKGSQGPVVHEPAPEVATSAVSKTSGKRYKFEDGAVRGEIAQLGGRIASLSFLKHLDKLPPEGKPIQHLNQDAQEFFFAESGFLGTSGLKTPTRETSWQITGKDILKNGGELQLTWKGDQGLTFKKIYTFTQDSYLFTVTDQIVNNSQKAFDLYHYAQFVRVKPTADDGSPAMAIADFEGPMGFLDDTRVQHPYEDLKEADQGQKATSGWVGISDKFFLAALIPEDTVNVKNFYFDYDPPAHRSGKVSNKKTIGPGSDITVKTKMYIGPKEVKTLESHNLDLNRAIDYGWFHFLAEPIVQVLLFLNGIVHNFGVAIILLTIGIKLVLYPLANKSYVSMNAMKKLQPKVEDLKVKHGDNKKTLNEEMMKLYQTNKVNPLGGCLPMIVQIPVFFALYKVLFLSVEMRHAPFMLWINDLSAQDPYYVLPVLMGASMYFQSKLNPTPADPIQAKIMAFLPLIFTFMFLTFPAGLVLYWLLNNVLSIAQQSYIMKKMG